MSKEVVMVDGNAGESDNNNVRLLTWDRVRCYATEFGNSLGIDKLLGDMIKAISIHIRAGDLGYLDVECYGEEEAIRKRIKGTPAEDVLMEIRALFQDGPPTYVVRFPLMSVSATAFGPMRKNTANKMVVPGMGQKKKPKKG
jgi:hypothetical protein